MRTHCVVCVRCQYVSAPCSQGVAQSTVARLNEATTCHEAVALTIEEARVVELMFDTYEEAFQ